MSIEKSITKPTTCLPDTIRAMTLSTLTRSEAQQIKTVVSSNTYARWLREPLLALAAEVLDRHVCLTLEQYEAEALAYAERAHGLLAFPDNLLFEGWCHEWHWEEIIDESVADLVA